jgi:hypothetical protein
MWVWVVFLPYALLDFWQVASFVVLGEAIFAEGLYIWIDPSIYIPMVMIVILMFYALLVKRLWVMPLTFPKSALGRFFSQRIGKAQSSNLSS